MIEGYSKSKQYYKLEREMAKLGIRLADIIKKMEAGSAVDKEAAEYLKKGERPPVGLLIEAFKRVETLPPEDRKKFSDILALRASGEEGPGAEENRYQNKK